MKSYVKQMKEFLYESQHGYTWDEEQGKYVRIDDSSETDESVSVDETAYTWDEEQGKYVRIDDAPASLTKESVELDELKRDEPEVVFDFKNQRDAKDFARTVENAAVGLANKGVERHKGKYRVVITVDPRGGNMHKRAIGKYAYENNGEFSHSSSEVTPKGYGPYDEEA